MGTEAIRTITGEWNGENAAERLVAFCRQKGFLKDAEAKEKECRYQEPVSGPCSIAPVISERKWKKDVERMNQAWQKQSL